MNRILLLFMILLFCLSANAQNKPATKNSQAALNIIKDDPTNIPQESTVFSQSTYLKNVSFIMLTAPAKKPVKDTLFLNPADAMKLRSFYKRYKAVSLPVFLKQDLYVNIECKAQVGICLDVSQQSKLKLKLKLQNSNDKSEIVVDVDNILNALNKKKQYWKARISEKEIDEAIKAAEDYPALKAEISGLKVALAASSLDYKTIREELKNVEENYIKTSIEDEKKKHVIRKILVHDILFINLTEHLISFYQEKQDTSMTCCPDNYEDNVREEAIKKVCGLLSVQKGIEIDVYGPDPTNKQLSYFNSENNLMPQDRPFKKSVTDSVPKIDPRKYLVIEEHKKKKNGIDTVWDKFRQKRNIIDSRSDVIIRFKQDQLKDEIFFRGNISLMAQINDSDPIEIPPYSVIGENFSTVGTNSLSPYDFALSFLTEMMSIYELGNKPDFIELGKRYNNGEYNDGLLKWLAFDNRSKNLETFIHHYLNDLRIKQYEINKSGLKKIIKFNTIDKKSIEQKYGEIYDLLQLNQLLDLDLTTLSLNLKANAVALTTTQTIEKQNLIQFIEDAIKNREHPDFYFNRRDSLAIGYQLNEYFTAAGKLTILENIYARMGTPNAFSLSSLDTLVSILKTDVETDGFAIPNLIEKDYISKADFVVRNLKNTKDYFDRFIKTDELTLFATLMEIHKDSLYLAHALESINDNLGKIQSLRAELVIIRNALAGADKINEPTRFKLQDLITQFTTQMKRYLATMQDLRNFEEEEFREAKKSYTGNESNNRWNSHEFTKNWAHDLANKAARQLYKKLIIGKIDLTKRSINDDSKLTIYVLWYDEPGKPPKKLQVASFILRKLGWNEQIADSFLLINRISDPGVTVNGGTAPSPTSRFKGAPGVSLMWTYTVGEYGDFFQRLQPSVGINVSYLDFDATQSFEVGVGAMLGFWRNKVFVGWGRNLHVTENSNYFLLGFSFAKIAETWNSKQTSNQSNK